MAEKNEKKIVNTASKAYGYNYASLADIVNQGFEMPKQKTGTDNGKEYIYSYDKELNEWVRGAEIVIPQMKGMNEAQKYGSALTYARRYSAQLQSGLVSDDDKKIETQEPKKSEIFDEPIIENNNIKNLADEFRSSIDPKEQDRILKGLNISRAEDMGMVNLQKYINYYRYAKEQTNKS